MRTHLQSFLAVLMATCFWTVAAAQQPAPMSLRHAVTLALEKNPDSKPQSDVDSAIGSRLARTALLPNLFFNENMTRGNDPVYVFGTRLRQQNFQAKDFALNNLNRPTPINNFTTRFSGNWLAFDSWHTQYEIRRADLLAQKTAAAATYSNEEIIHHVVEAYQSVLLAIRQTKVADHDLETAKSLLSLSEARLAWPRCRFR